MENLDPELPPMLNESRFYHHGLPMIHVGGLHPYRVVNLTVTVVSHFGYSKRVFMESRTLAAGLCLT